MSSIDRGVRWFWERVERSTAPAEEGLPVLRIATGLFLLVFSAPYLTWVNRAPPAFYHPPLLSPTRLLSGFPPLWLSWLIEAVLLALCAALVLGVRARVTTLALLGLCLLRANVAYSFGKIDHDIMILVLLGCMAFSGWGSRFALLPDPPSRFDSPPRAFALLGVCLAYAMSSVGFQKALNWLDLNLDSSGFLGWFVHGYFEYGRRHLLAPFVLSLPPLALEVVDYAGVVFELGCAVALLLGALPFRVWLVCACAFHLVNTLTLNIPFFDNMVVYLAFVDFSAAVRAFERVWRRGWVRVLAVVAVLGMPLAHICLRAAGIGSSFMFVVDKRRDQLLLLYASLICWAVALLFLVGEVTRRRRRAC